MRIIVTGAAGFIGSNLCNALAFLGHKVHAIDNLYLGNWDNIQELKENQVNEQSLDVLNMADMTSMFEQVQPEVVFHLAAASSSPMFKHQERWGLNTNIIGFTNIMHMAREVNARKVIYASSSSLYNGVVPPWSEFDLVEPTTFYEVSFRAREEIAHAYFEEYGLVSAGMRFFSVYGPREEHKGEYANNLTQFLWAILKGRSPVIYGDGNQSRDFIHVDDVVKCLILTMDKDLDQNCIFNVGRGFANTFNQIVDMINAELGTDIAPRMVENPLKNYVFNTLADMDWTEKTLGFRARITPGGGIKNLYSYYKDSRSLYAV